MNKYEADQAQRDYMELVFLYKRLGVAQHIVAQLVECERLNQRGIAVGKVAGEEIERCEKKLFDVFQKLVGKSAK